LQFLSPLSLSTTQQGLTSSVHDIIASEAAAAASSGHDVIWKTGSTY